MVFDIAIKPLSAWIDSLTLRERGLVFAVVIVSLAFLWYVFVYESFELRKGQLEQELTQADDDISSMTRTIEQIRSNGLFDPNKSIREQFNRAQSELMKRKAQIDSETAELINPQQMAKALEELLLQNGNMHLIKLETVAPVNLFESAKNSKNPRISTDVPAVYRHGLKIEFEGGYLETLRYLKALEALKWRFYWDSVNYQVKDYPLGRVKISVYTLSFEEEWLGV